MKNFTKIVIIAVFLCAALRPSLASGQFFFMENENIGKPVPDFTLPTLSGQKVNLTQFLNGKRGIIFFWATWCPHCRAALDELNRDKDKIAQENIQLVLVDVGEDEAAVRKYLERNKINFEVFLDQKNSLAEDYGLIGIPTFYFVDEKGIVKDVGHSHPENYAEIFSK